MSTTETRTENIAKADIGHVDMKLEAMVIPVSDVDRAKAFYARLGWRLDADFAFDNGFRVVQFTPPGSAASVQFGTMTTTAEAVPDRVRHRCCSRRARRPRGGRQRGVPPSTAGRSIPTRRHEHTAERASGRSRQLHLVRDVQRLGG